MPPTHPTGLPSSSSAPTKAGSLLGGGLWNRVAKKSGEQALRRVLHFPANKVGRDFVVGDLHGCLEPLGRLMEAVKFHPGRDRLFSVGDLVDRGPFSMACLKLLRMPWFHAVRGNHEQHLIEHLQDPFHVKAFDERWLRQQALTFSQRQQFASEWLPTLRALPVVIVVGEGESRFQVVHAELLEEGRSVTNAMIDAWDFSDPVKSEKRAMSGRILLSTHRRGGKVLRAHDREQMSVTYSGHTIVQAPFRLAGQVFLDRGAFLGQHLSEAKLGPEEGEAPEKDVRAGLVMVEPASGLAWMAPTDPPGRAFPVDIPVLAAQ